MDPEQFDLGTYARPATTTSSLAKRWFDQGLRWVYAYNHDEAIVCFEHALAEDDAFALAHWGIALAVGPNYNKDWDAFDGDELTQALARAHREITRAAALAGGTSAVEQGLIAALARRFPQAEPGDDLQAWNADYAAALVALAGAHPEDLDVAALTADALMTITAWQLWDVAFGRPADGAHTLQAKAILDRALAQPGGTAHSGLLHFSVHLMEMSGTPELALPAADALRVVAGRDAGHLLHMPTHIDVLCGDYQRVITDNTAAVAADERYVAHAGPLNFYTLYRAHNHHFRVYGAMFAGNRGVALEAAAALQSAIPEELLRVATPPMADWLEGFVPVKLHVLIRFGLWEDILAEPFPTDAELYATMTAMLHYARGIAFAAISQVSDAEAERALLNAAAARVPESRYLFNNTCVDILAVASAMLDGEIEYRKGNHDQAFELLRRAIALDDGLPYDEPWGWMQPVRHAYGALLLEQGHVEEAAAVYAADLGFDATLGRACQHPDNVWSLHGYHECLERLGRTDEARIVKRRFDLVSARADVPIQASCLCRLEVVDAVPAPSTQPFTLSVLTHRGGAPA